MCVCVLGNNLAAAADVAAAGPFVTLGCVRPDCLLGGKVFWRLRNKKGMTGFPGIPKEMLL